MSQPKGPPPGQSKERPQRTADKGDILAAWPASLYIYIEPLAVKDQIGVSILTQTPLHLSILYPHGRSAGLRAGSTMRSTHRLRLDLS